MNANMFGFGMDNNIVLLLVLAVFHLFCKQIETSRKRTFDIAERPAASSAEE